MVELTKNETLLFLWDLVYSDTCTFVNPSALPLALTEPKARRFNKAHMVTQLVRLPYEPIVVSRN